MAKQTYKVKPAEYKGDKIKNIVIIVLSCLLVLSIVCIFQTTSVIYTPEYEAVRENTDLKLRISELEDELNSQNSDKEKSDKDDTAKNNNIAPPNQHVEGYEEYQKSLTENAD